LGNFKGLSFAIGIDVAIACVGFAKTANQANLSVRKGRMVIVVGERPAVDLGPMQDRELDVRGSLICRRQDYAEAIRCLGQGGITFDPLPTKCFSFRLYL
jgi:L-iditol 2-dehydrogenase